MTGEKFKIVVGYIFICLVWGSTWLTIKLGLFTLTPFISAGIRFLIAAILIFTIVKFRGLPIQIDSKAIKLYLYMALFSFIIPFWLIYWAEQYIPSGLTSVLFGIFPFSVFFFSLILLKNEEVDKYKLLSIIMGFIGVAIIFIDGMKINLENHLLGLIAVLVSAFMQGSVAVVIKKWGGYLNSFSMNGVPLFIAGIVMTLIAFIFEDFSSWVFTSKAVASIIYLAIFGTILAFTVYFWLLKRINVVVLSLSSFITPIIAILLGWFFLNEKLSDKVLLGSVLVLMGILFGNFSELKKYYLCKRISNA